MRAARRAALVLLLASSSLALHAYVRNAFGGLPVSRDDEFNISFVFATGGEAGLRNADGEVWITPGSDALAAVRQAAANWTAVEGSRLSFAAIRPGPVEVNGNDRKHWIGFRDDPELRSVIGDAIAITSLFGFGQTLTDTEIYFNPDPRNRDGDFIPFSTDGAPDTWDIEATALHEFGHALGADHTSVLGAAMYQAGRPGETFARALRDDDIAFAVSAYPTDTGLDLFGTLSGVVRAGDGSPIVGGAVTALDPATGRVVSGVTRSDGSYEFLAPPNGGGYLIYVEPLDGPVFGFNVGLEDANESFAPTILGGPTAPQTRPLAAGQVVSVDLVVADGPPELNPNLIAIQFADGSFFAGGGPTTLRSGESATLLLVGPGLETVAEDELFLIGEGLRITPNSFTSFPPEGLLDGAIGFGIESLAPPGPTQSGLAGALGTILLRSESSFAAYTAGLVVTETVSGIPTPLFSSQSIVSAASFAGGGVAPGEIATIFGVNLGPAAPTLVREFDAATGRLPTEFAGVQATFNGVPSPLFFVFEGQLNLQVPYELEGANTAQVVVSYNGAAGGPVTVPVLPARPGLFTQPRASQAIIVNQDGSINSASSPAPRGSVVVAYATGQGSLDNPIATGAPAGGDPLSRARNVSATVGGAPATVLFGGMSPDFVGLMQVNLRVPPAAPMGSAVPFVVAVDGASSQAGVTIAVAE